MRRLAAVVAAALVCMGLVVIARPAGAQQAGVVDEPWVLSQCPTTDEAVCFGPFDLGGGTSMRMLVNENSNGWGLQYHFVSGGTPEFVFCYRFRTVSTGEFSQSGRPTSAQNFATGARDSGQTNFHSKTVGVLSEFQYGWFAPISRNGGNGGQCSTVPPPPSVELPTPAQLCERAYEDQAGNQVVRLTSKVLNPVEGLVDSVELYVDWSETPLTATTGVFDLPDLSSKPSGGWRGKCVVTRTVPASTGQTTYLPAPWDPALPTVEITDSTEIGDMAPLATGVAAAAFVASPAAPWVTALPGTSSAAATAASAAGVSLTAAGAVVGAGVLVAGGLVAAHDSGLINLDVLDCSLIDRLHNFGIDCPEPQQLETAYGRSQVRFIDASGQPLTQSQLESGIGWKQAVSVGEVIIDPERAIDPSMTPEERQLRIDTNQATRGRQTVVVVQPMPTTTEQQDRAAELVNSAPESRTDPESDRDDCQLGLLEILNPLSMFRTIKCALKAAFVPREGTVAGMFSDLRTAVAVSFPFSVYSEVSSFTSELQAQLADEGGHGSACSPGLNFGDVIRNPADGSPVDALNVKLPTPSDSGCEGFFDPSGARTEQDDEVGDLFGFREPVRALATGVMWTLFALRVVRTFSPEGRAQEMEPVI